MKEKQNESDLKSEKLVEKFAIFTINSYPNILNLIYICTGILTNVCKKFHLDNEGRSTCHISRLDPQVRPDQVSHGPHSWHAT